MKIELGTQSSPNYTYSQDGDAPVGFTSSFKVLNNANASQGSSGTIYHVIGQHVEQNVIDHLGWGTANPKPVTISFWVKSNVTGNDVIELVIRRNGTSSNDSIAGQITIDTADTWEYKTVTFPGTTTDIGRPASNALGFNLFFSFQGLVGGNKISSYGTWDNNNRLGGPAGDTNVFASTSGAYINITGVQLEVGERATPFEHRSYGDEFAKCLRYYQRVTVCSGNDGAGIMRGSSISGASEFGVNAPVSMRARPSITNLTSNNTLSARSVNSGHSAVNVTLSSLTANNDDANVDALFSHIRIRCTPGLSDGEPYVVFSNSQGAVVLAANAEL